MFITVCGQQIHFEQEGSGPDVLLLHGWGYDCTLLQKLADALSSDFRVTLCDMPGHGLTKEPETPMTIYDYADVLQGLLEGLHIKRTHVICHSFGGRLSIILASRRPDLVGRMIFCSAAGVRPKRTAKYYVRLWRYRTAKRLLKAFAPRKLEAWQSGKGSEDYKKLSPVMKVTFSNIVNEDLTPLLHRIQAPVFLLWGSEDTQTPLWMAETMDKEIPDSALVVYTGRTHYAFLEELPRTVAIARTFFGKV